MNRCLKLGLPGTLAFSPLLVVALVALPPLLVTALAPVALTSPPAENTNIQNLARLTTVRILTPTASGSGAIVQRQGQTYTVLTSWHVVGFSNSHTIATPDGQQYSLVGSPRQLGNTDMGIVQFRVGATLGGVFPEYQVAPISTQAVVVGEPVFAAGFPMYHKGTLTTTFDLGVRAFRFTTGEVSLLLPKSLYQGYRLGYTNDIEVGMSGGPIFNSRGQIVGINGRVKHRDPDFGVYAFEDGTEPPPEMLEQMVNSSWGIPITTYLQLATR